MFPVPPCETFFDESSRLDCCRLVNNVPDCPAMFVLALFNDGDLFTERHLLRELVALPPIGLGLLGSIHPIESDVFLLAIRDYDIVSPSPTAVTLAMKSEEARETSGKRKRNKQIPMI